MRDALQGHLLGAVVVCERLLARSILDVVADLVALLFIFIADVLLEEATLVLDFHVHRVVHQALTNQIRILPLTFRQ
jgi:hypothetical protein